MLHHFNKLRHLSIMPQHHGYFKWCSVVIIIMIIRSQWAESVCLKFNEHFSEHFLSKTETITVNCSVYCVLILNIGHYLPSSPLTDCSVTYVNETNSLCYFFLIPSPPGQFFKDKYINIQTENNFFKPKYFWDKSHLSYISTKSEIHILI